VTAPQPVASSGAAPAGLLRVEDLRTTFDTARGPVRAVDGVSLELDAGRTLGIVGESGSGKTVLARSVMGLLPRHGVTVAGHVWFEGQDLLRARPSDLRALWGARMGMVFQDPMTTLSPVVRIGRQITEVIRRHEDVSRHAAAERAEALLRSVGVPDPARRLRDHPHQLSGGLRQRVCIAIALACGPALLLADEPTTALDVTIQAQILTLLASEQRRRSMAMILVTHDLGVVAGRTDEVAVMYAGKVVERAPTARLFAAPRMPYTAALMASLPRLSQPSHTRLTAIQGRPPDPSAFPAGCRFAPRCPRASERCREEEPPLTDAESPGHAYACWHPLEATVPA
jgi:peptide/nickel transport system ATP-binding protein